MSSLSPIAMVATAAEDRLSIWPSLAHRVALQGFSMSSSLFWFFLLGFALPTLALWVVGLLR